MKKVSIYEGGKNKWQKNRYRFMGNLNISEGIQKFGKAKKKGNIYAHILSGEDKSAKLFNLLNEQEIYDEVNVRFKTKAGDKVRLLTNTLASQTSCFNLFAPLKKRLGLASKLFSELFNKEVIVTDIILEYTPKKNKDLDETIGDQSVYGGTDSDLAVYYHYDNGRKGILLLEFKYIEAEFSSCTSYREKNGRPDNKGIIKPNIRPNCDSSNFYSKQIASNIKSNKKQFDCGYLRYLNWQLTEKSRVFDHNKIINHNGCPFRFSLNQLWRNMLLAEKIATIRNLDEFGFWVISPKENQALWNDQSLQNVKFQFESILSPLGKAAFNTLEIDKDIVSKLEKLAEDNWSKQWLEKFRNRYLTETE